MTTTTLLTPAETERFSAIMGACPTHWSWWRSIEYHGGDWDRPSDVTLGIDDPDDETKVIVKRVSARAIVRALGTAVRTVPSMKHIDPYDEYLDLDADESDCVLQIAVLGQVVYG
jgi:hypothetical protein